MRRHTNLIQEAPRVNHDLNRLSCPAIPESHPSRTGYRVNVSPETGELLFTQEPLPEVKKLGDLR